MQVLFFKNKKCPKMDIQLFAPCPKNAKIFFPEIRNPDVGTSIRAKIRALHPLKMAKPFSGKQETPILGHHAPHFGTIF